MTNKSWKCNKPLQMYQKIPEKQIFPSLSLFQRQLHLEHQLVECLICVRHRTAVVAAVGGWTDRKPVPKINSWPGSSFILVTTNIFANICWISNQLYDTALHPSWQLVQWKFDKSRDIDLVDIARFWMTITNVGGLQRPLHPCAATNCCCWWYDAGENANINTCQRAPS